MENAKKIYIIISIICVLSIVLGAYAQFFGKRDSKTSDIPTNNTTDENVIENPVQPEKEKTMEELKDSAKRIFDLGVKNVVIKGGKSFSDTVALDILYDGSKFEIFETEKIDTPYNHGAGCSFAACITAELAKGLTVYEAVSQSKMLITEALKNSFKLNEFVGPLYHKAFALKE